MYTYKTEILTVGTKWLSDKADANEIGRASCRERV